MLEPARNRHAKYYADKELKSFPREKMNPWLNGEKKLLNNVEAMRRYAAEISGVDDGVGRIMAALKANKLDDDTLVIFTADQGLAGGQNGFWGMGDHTRPLTAFDWTTHVPLIYRYPGHIRAGQRPTSGQQLRFPTDRARLRWPEREDTTETATPRSQLQRHAEW